MNAGSKTRISRRWRIFVILSDSGLSASGGFLEGREKHSQQTFARLDRWRIQPALEDQKNSVNQVHEIDWPGAIWWNTICVLW